MQLVEAVPAGNAAKQRVARIHHLVQQVGEGRGNGDNNAIQHAEAGGTPERDEREDELHAADPPELAQRVDIDEAERRRHQYGAEGGDGQYGQRRPQVEHDHEQCRGRHDAGELRPAADIGVDRGPRIGSGDRESAEQARRDVGGTEADHFAVGVDRIAAARAKASGRDDPRRETDEEYGGRAEQEPVDREAGPGGSDSEGSTDGMSPTTAIPIPGNRIAAESMTETTTTTTGPGTGRRSMPTPCSTANMEAARRSDGQWTDRDLARQFEDRRDQPVRLDLEAGNPADLAYQDRQRNAGEEADQDRPRQEGGQHAEPQHPRAEIHPAHHKGQHRRGGDAIDRGKPRSAAPAPRP